MPPTMSPDLTRASARSSKRRISRIIRYRPSGVSRDGVISLLRTPLLRTPQHRAVLRVGVVRGLVGGFAYQRVVVVPHQAAVGPAVRPPAVLAVLQVEGDRPAGPAAAGVSAAVVDPRMVGAHMPAGGNPRHGG